MGSSRLFPRIVLSSGLAVQRYRTMLSSTTRCFFVSSSNPLS
jgi:hypothetical protein